MQALERRHHFGFQDVFVAHGLHAKDAHLFLYQNRHHFLAEAAEVRVHDVQRHLRGVETKTVFVGHFQHTQMHTGIFVAGEAHEAYLSGFLGFLHGFHRATFGEKPIGIFEADILVKLPQVNVIDFQTLQRFVQLFQR